MRLFFALLPAAEDAAKLAGHVLPCVQRLGAQAVPAANFHATLLFLGEVTEPELPRLRDAVAAVRVTRHELWFSQLDHWDKPRILCVTPGDEAVASAALALSESLSGAVRAADFSPDLKPFRPHVTVARKVSKERAREIEWPRPLAVPFGIRCEQFALMRSDRSEVGSMYSVVDEWLLDA